MKLKEYRNKVKDLEGELQEAKQRDEVAQNALQEEQRSKEGSI